MKLAGTSVTQHTQSRVHGIDSLRGLCIVAVVLHHINLRIRLDALTGRVAANVLFWNGYYGVRVFFVISGFLIATWSLKRWGDLRKINLPQFYLMRFARIAPCLLGLLAILALMVHANIDDAFRFASPDPPFSSGLQIGLRTISCSNTLHRSNTPSFKIK